MESHDRDDGEGARDRGAKGGPVTDCEPARVSRRARSLPSRVLTPADAGGRQTGRPARTPGDLECRPAPAGADGRRVAPRKAHFRPLDGGAFCVRGREARRGGVRSATRRLSARPRRPAEAAATEAALEDVRIRYLGRQGVVAQAFRTLGQAPAEDRPRLGQALNALKASIEAAVARRAETLAAAARRDAAVRGADRCHAARPAARARTDARADARARRDRGDLSRPRIRDRRGTRGRARPRQLRATEHAALPSRAGRAGLVLPRGGVGAADAHDRRRRARPGHVGGRRCARSRTDTATGAIRSTPVTRRCFSRSTGSWSMRASASPT